MSHLDELMRVCVPPTSPTGSNTAWPQIEAALRAPLPSDYKEYIARYGRGSIDEFLWVLSPSDDNENLSMVVQSEVRREAQREFRSAAGQQLPFAIYPEPGGLLPWGFTDNGDVCYWRTGNVDPDRWPVVIVDSRSARWEEFAGSMTGFIVAVLTGRHVSRVFPDDIPSSKPEFRSV